MAGYIGSKAVNLSTTGADINGDANIDGDLSFRDNDKAIFGAGSDLQIYHTGSDSWVKDNGTGNLYLDTNGSGINISYNNSNENMATFTANGAATLYYDNSAKIATTSTGIQVTGNIAKASGDLTLDVAGEINLDADGAVVNFQDGGTTFGLVTQSSSDFVVRNPTLDKDIVFKGNDGGVTTTALTLDISQAGRATFNEGIVLKSSTGGDFGVNINTASGDSMKLQVVDTGSAGAANGVITVTDGDLILSPSANVGIGTSSPSTRLTVGAGAGTEEIRVDAGAGWADLTLNSNSTNGGHIYFNDGSNAGEIFYYHVSDYMAFNTAGTERMRIDSSGSVGIGKVPTASLDVLAPSNQEPLILTVTSNGYGYATFRNAAGNDVGYWGLGSGLVPSGSSEDFALRAQRNDLVFCAGGGTERMRIDSSGRLGLKTSANASFDQVAGANLFVLGSGAGDQGMTIYSGNSGTGNIMFADGTTTSTQYEGYLQYVHSDNRLLFGTNHATRMTIDSSGNLLVGTANATIIGNGGIGLKSDGRIDASTSGGSTMLLERRTNDGDIAAFYKDGTTVGSIGTLSSRLHLVNGDTGLRFAGDLDAIWPCNGSGGDRDNAIDLGSTGIRFDDIYATNGTIQTSDRNEKQDIAELTDAEQRVAVAAKGLLRKFRWKDAVAEKGDEARTHFGIIAQDLQAAFAAEGLDAGDYAMFISSTWTDEDTGEERTRMGVRYSELLAFIIGAL